MVTLTTSCFLQHVVRTSDYMYIYLLTTMPYVASQAQQYKANAKTTAKTRYEAFADLGFCFKDHWCTRIEAAK